MVCLGRGDACFLGQNMHPSDRFNPQAEANLKIGSIHCEFKIHAHSIRGHILAKFLDGVRIGSFLVATTVAQHHRGSSYLVLLHFAHHLDELVENGL